MLPNFKQKYQSYLDALQIEAPHSKITRTSANQSTIDKFCAKENFTLFSGVTRDLILGYWLSNKVVYKIPPETLQFLANEFKIEHIGTDSNELIKRACKKPIYVELPDDAPVNSFFCGYTYLISKKLGSTNTILFTAVSEGFIFFVFIILNNFSKESPAILVFTLYAEGISIMPDQSHPHIRIYKTGCITYFTAVYRSNTYCQSDERSSRYL